MLVKRRDGSEVKGERSSDSLKTGFIRFLFYLAGAAIIGVAAVAGAHEGRIVQNATEIQHVIKRIDRFEENVTHKQDRMDDKLDLILTKL